MEGSKHAIIAGASSGIGRALVIKLVKDGYKVGVIARRKSKLQELKDVYKQNILVKSFDISDHVNAINCLKDLIAELGALDLFIFTAGIGHHNPKLLNELDEEIVNLNVCGFNRFMNTVYNYMQSNGGGQIVNISSLAALRGNHNHVSYHASKSYQCIYLEGLRKKSLKDRNGIAITDIRPGFIKTRFVKYAPKYWLVSLDHAVEQMYPAIKRKRKVVYVTKRFLLFVFLMKLLPCWAYDRCP
jgi:short-subunit dehydrogenase